jgi:hypothetical protein
MSALQEKSRDAVPAARPGSWLRPAIIRNVRPDGRVDVRVSFDDGTDAVTARLLQLVGYQPSEGDRVLVAGEGGDDQECFVIGVVHSARPTRVELGDGSHVQVHDGELELRDASDRLLLRYADGSAELAAPAGDLMLSSPNGRVVVKAATDVSIEAARDFAGHAGRRVELGCVDLDGEEKLSRFAMDPKSTTVETPKLEVRAKQSELVSAKATLIARRIAVTAEHVAQNVEHYELYADKLVEKARNSFREVSGLAQSTLGRARSVVRGIYSLRTQRSIMISKEETSIDGERILLG